MTYISFSICKAHLALYIFGCVSFFVTFNSWCLQWALRLLIGAKSVVVAGTLNPGAGHVFCPHAMTTFTYQIPTQRHMHTDNVVDIDW